MEFSPNGGFEEAVENRTEPARVTSGRCGRDAGFIVSEGDNAGTGTFPWCAVFVRMSGTFQEQRAQCAGEFEASQKPSYDREMRGTMESCGWWRSLELEGCHRRHHHM